MKTYSMGRRHGLISHENCMITLENIRDNKSHFANTAMYEVTKQRIYRLLQKEGWLTDTLELTQEGHNALKEYSAVSDAYNTVLPFDEL